MAISSGKGKFGIQTSCRLGDGWVQAGYSFPNHVKQ